MQHSSTAKPVSCGVLVMHGSLLLLGHATRTPRWDIPKGLADPGEDHRTTALRELLEETGLAPTSAALADLGLHTYLPRKDLALFAWTPDHPPDPASLICTSMVIPRTGQPFPEFDRFGLFPRAEVQTLVSPNLMRVLAAIPAYARACSP